MLRYFLWACVDVSSSSDLANFAAFLYSIKLSSNLLFLKSVLNTYIPIFSSKIYICLYYLCILCLYYIYSVSSIFLVIEYWLLIHISSRVLCYNIIIEYHRFYHRILYILWSNFPWVIFPCIICRIFSPHLKQLSLWRPHYCSAAKIVEFRSGLSWSVLLLWLARRCELQFSLQLVL